MSCKDEEDCMSSAFCFIYDVDQYHITKNSSKLQRLCYLKKQESFLKQELKM